jgi:hypothetical protein
MQSRRALRGGRQLQHPVWHEAEGKTYGEGNAFIIFYKFLQYI